MPTLKLVRERSASSQTSAGDKGQPVTSHVARLWARDEIRRLISVRKTLEAIQLAGLYQLVTPVSGAVVLETKQQYDQAGLMPTDPSTVPSVPEPGTCLLIIVGLILLWPVLRRRGYAHP